MFKKLLSISLLALSALPALAQPEEGEKETEVYKYNFPLEIPLTAVTGGFAGFAFTKIYDKPPSDLSTIQALDKKNINGFDRWAAGMNSESAEKTSDLLFYGSIPLPFTLLLDRKIRKDALKFSFLYLEAMSITGVLYTGTDLLVDRYRPETYAIEPDAETRRGGNYKNSFFAGHVALVGTTTFFMAKVYNDYHPNDPWRWAFWSGAAIATGATGYLRHRGGKHFPTDILVGALVGVGSGILVPQFHKPKPGKKYSLIFSPDVSPTGGTGLAMTYRF